MEAFWDARAREHAAFYVDNRLDYDAPDLEAFWAAGEEGADFVLGGLGLEVGPDDDLVEIGAGIGRITRVLAARARSVRALDVSAEMLSGARPTRARQRRVGPRRRADADRRSPTPAPTASSPTSSSSTSPTRRSPTAT